MDEEVFYFFNYCCKRRWTVTYYIKQCFQLTSLLNVQVTEKKCDEVKQYGRMVLYRMRGQKSNKNSCETIQMYPHQSTFNPPSKVNVDNEPNTKKRFFPSELREAKSRALHLATATGKLSTGTLYQWKRHLIPRIERNDWQLKHRQRAFLREDEQKVLQVFMKRKHTHSQ